VCEPVSISDYVRVRNPELFYIHTTQKWEREGERQRLLERDYITLGESY
jgi:hypothetical protein